MYALSKGNANKLLVNVKSRRGISQKLDNLDLKDQSSKSSSPTGLSSPKPVFHLHGKRSQQQKSPQEAITPQHEEMIRYINETWKCVKRDYEQASKPGDLNGASLCATHKVPSVCYYNTTNKTNGAADNNFEPFDLESFWGQRLFQNITQSNA